MKFMSLDNDINFILIKLIKWRINLIKLKYAFNFASGQLSANRLMNKLKKYVDEKSRSSLLINA
jgi:hypothetical protein